MYDDYSMSVEDPTLAELLTAVNAAILNLLTSKISSYSLNGIAYNYHNIDELKKLRGELRQEVAGQSGSTIRLADISNA